MKLFHGSNVSITKIELSKCKLYKDFGQAFYLTEDKEQALAVANARVALLGGKPVTNEFEFDSDILGSEELSFHSFEGYSEEWAEFIFKHRDDSVNPPYKHSYDVVYGPIADDRVGLQIRNFKLGYIDMAEFLRRLRYMKGITYQWAFCTERAISYLKKV